MLDLLTSSNSTQVIYKVIRELTGDIDYVDFEATISATINGEIKIENEIIKVLLTNSRPNYALIDIMWEDYGYKNYKDMGLFGHMSTQWQEVKMTGNNAFTIYSDTYEIEIKY